MDPATGGVTPDNGGKVTITDGSGNTTTITPPNGGEVKPGADGGVVAPGGSTVTKPGGSTSTVPAGGGTVKPDGTVSDDNGKLDSGETVNLTGGGTVKREGDTVTIADKNGTGTDAVVKPDGTVTIPGGGKVTVTTPDGKTQTVNVPAGGSVDPSSPITPPAPPIGGGGNGGGGGGGGGGGSYEPTYRPTIEKTSHGSVTVQPSAPEQGDQVTITVKPDKGYEVEKITVTDQNNKPVNVKDNGNGTFTFTQPRGKVSIRATFQTVQPSSDWASCSKDGNCLVHAYTDTSATAWYHDGVHYCLQNGLMGGYGNGTFGPNDNLSRAQLAQILYNHAGRPDLTSASPFTDVAGDAWCASAITWAAEQGIVGGYGNGLFGPNDNITREQLAVMLWRYAGSPAATDKELHFTDADEAGNFALDALRWAVESGIISGYGDGRLGPKGQATRAQVATMLQRYLENS